MTEMIQERVKMRPTLIVLSGNNRGAMGQLGEALAGKYENDMEKLRLSVKMNLRARMVGVSSLHDTLQDFMEKSGQGFIDGGMHVLTGFDGSADHLEKIDLLKQTDNPVITLVHMDGATASTDLATEAVAISSNVPIEKQIDKVHKAVQENRNLNCPEVDDMRDVKMPQIPKRN